MKIIKFYLSTYPNLKMIMDLKGDVCFLAYKTNYFHFFFSYKIFLSKNSYIER